MVDAREEQPSGRYRGLRVLKYAFTRQKNKRSRRV
jgi:hypothetical protein